MEYRAKSEELRAKSEELTDEIISKGKVYEI